MLSRFADLEHSFCHAANPKQIAGVYDIILQVQLPDDLETYRSRGQLCRIDSDSGFEQSNLRGPERQQSLYDIRENQERALSRPLQAFLMENYITDIEQKLLESLRWMHERGLKPKLEGR